MTYWIYEICAPRHQASMSYTVNTLGPRQDGRNSPDDIFKCIFLNENVWILIEISLKFVSKGPINNIPALVQIMAWRRPGDKPLSEPKMVRMSTNICVTRPQWVKDSKNGGGSIKLAVPNRCSGNMTLMTSKLKIKLRLEHIKQHSRPSCWFIGRYWYNSLSFCVWF